MVYYYPASASRIVYSVVKELADEAHIYGDFICIIIMLLVLSILHEWE